MRNLQEQVKQHSVTENCSSDREKLLKFEAEGREFNLFFKLLISNKLEQLELKLEKYHAGKVRKKL